MQGTTAPGAALVGMAGAAGVVDVAGGGGVVELVEVVEVDVTAAVEMAMVLVGPLVVGVAEVIGPANVVESRRIHQ